MAQRRSRPAVPEEAAEAKEQRLARLAADCELALHRSPRRDPDAAGFGTYELVTVRQTKARSVGSVVCGDSGPAGFGRTLAQIEAYLAGLEVHLRRRYGVLPGEVRSGAE